MTEHPRISLHVTWAGGQSPAGHEWSRVVMGRSQVVQAGHGRPRAGPGVAGAGTEPLSSPHPPGPPWERVGTHRSWYEGMVADCGRLHAIQSSLCACRCAPDRGGGGTIVSPQAPPATLGTGSWKVAPAPRGPAGPGWGHGRRGQRLWLQAGRESCTLPALQGPSALQGFPKKILFVQVSVQVFVRGGGGGGTRKDAWEEGVT